MIFLTTKKETIKKLNLQVNKLKDEKENQNKFFNSKKSAMEDTIIRLTV